MNTYIENLNWRYATKLFDNSKSVSEEELNKILEAIQLSASSYGLQPYKILVVEDKELKEKLKLAAFNQPQLTDASHILIFANYTSIDENYINTYIENIAETRNTTSDNLKGFKNMLTGSILNLKSEDQNQWAAKQTYIALATNAVRTGIVAGLNAVGIKTKSNGVQGSNGISIFGCLN